MNRKIKRIPQTTLSMKRAFDEFVVAQTAKGLTEPTIKNYHAHFHSISRQALICKGWFLPSNTYDCGSFVVN